MQSFAEDDWFKGMVLAKVSISAMTCLLFITACTRLRLKIRSSYRYLTNQYAWRIIMIGVTLCVCMILEIWFDIVALKSARTGRPTLASTTTKGQIYHWFEFSTILIPGIVIMLAYQPRDNFSVFNKFPD